ncbi:acyl carrier protein [Actinomadura rubrisoli]|uniref:Acyl carrier protein n=1 Tax=Actinomadura rubrisoli TaxID=2530368 RepID=A0A4R5BD29_9ACTN|nr:acyl carrier protein [Actinomadura rubrisoli]TDD82680.1 acyl carrier protein [Actinomadura rubrisoli]
MRPKDAVHELLVGRFNVDAEQVDPGRTLRDLRLDSVALVEFALEVEDRFGVRLPEEGAATMTVEQIVAYLQGASGPGEGG